MSNFIICIDSFRQNSQSYKREMKEVQSSDLFTMEENLSLDSKRGTSIQSWLIKG